MSEHDEWQATWHGLHDILGPKWTFHILRILSEDSHGFNAIRDSLDGLTAPILSQRLKELRCHGLVDRTVETTTPPTTTYSLTPTGTEIATRLRGLESLVEINEQPARDCSAETTDCRSEALADGCVTAANQC